MASLSTCFYFNIPFQSQSQRSGSSLNSIRHPVLHPLKPLTAVPTSPSLKFPVLCCLSNALTPASTQNAETQTHYIAITEFLLKECKLSAAQVVKILQGRASLTRARSTHTAENAVNFLRDSGFTENQVRKTILRNPSFLELKVDGQLKLKIDFIKSELGLGGEDLGHVISTESRLLNFSLENTLVPRISYLENLFGSKANLSKGLKRAPGLLISDVEKLLKPKLELLKQYGFQGELLFHLLLVAPTILCSTTVKSLKSKLEYVKSMGILKGSKTFIYGLRLVTSNNYENLEKKLKCIANLGLLPEEIQELLRKAPVVLALSTKKMEKNMNFLTHTARLSPNIVVTYPLLLGFSLEKRLKPRYEVFKALNESQGSKNLPNLASMLNISERVFLEKFGKTQAAQ